MPSMECDLEDWPSGFSSNAVRHQSLTRIGIVIRGVFDTVMCIFSLCLSVKVEATRLYLFQSNCATSLYLIVSAVLIKGEYCLK